MLCHKTGWLPEKIPDDQIPVPSTLAMMKVAKTKCIRDPNTRKIVLESAPIVTRAKTNAMDDEFLLKMAMMSASLESGPDIDPTLK